jgi:diaminopimelate decarboxylase
VGQGVLSSAFPRKNGVLTAGALSLEDLALQFGTPLYVYDADVIRERYQRLVEAFTGVDLMVAYSVKANGSLGVLDLLRQLGAGADIVSGGELFRSRRVGIPANRIVFAGVGKTDSEIRAGLSEGIRAFHVESKGELIQIDRIASEMKVRAPIGLRVNPDIVSPTPHEYTRTGHALTKFGILSGEAVELYQWADQREWLDPVGIDVHIGSQITSPEPHALALDAVLTVVDELSAVGITLEYVDLGGGFGVRYEDSPNEMPLDRLAELVVPRMREAELELILEPGRFLVGDAGVLVTEVLGAKRNPQRTFVIVDAGMTELLRPSHYGGEHAIDPVRAEVELSSLPDGPPVDIVGPICETGDFLARDRKMAVPNPGTLLAVRTAGAYGFAMASNYNGRTRPAEVLVDGAEAHLIRERESFDDLIRGERVPGEDSYQR